MALKYQALNGYVISKTTTIQGADITKPGAPMIASCIVDTEGNITPLFRFSHYASTSYTAKAAATNSSDYNSKDVNYSITVNGITGIAYNNTGALSIIYKLGTNKTVKGVATWVCINASGDITTHTVNVSITGTGSGTTYPYMAVFAKPADSNYVVSFTFEPTA